MLLEYRFSQGFSLHFSAFIITFGCFFSTSTNTRYINQNTFVIIMFNTASVERTLSYKHNEIVNINHLLYQKIQSIGDKFWSTFTVLFDILSIEIFISDWRSHRRVGGV